MTEKKRNGKNSVSKKLSKGKRNNLKKQTNCPKESNFAISKVKRSNQKQQRSLEQKRRVGRRRREGIQNREMASSHKPVRRKFSEKNRRNKPRISVNRMGKELLLTFLLFSLLLLLIQSAFFSLPKMEGYSMMPTLMEGERFFVNKRGSVRRFSLICYRDPETGTTGIRRVIGLPEEQLGYREDQLIINDQEVVERFLEDEKNRAKANGTVLTEDFTLFEITGKDRLSKEEYFVLGDNRSYASDSRTFGTVKKKDIIGVVELRWLPFHRLTGF